MLKPTKEQHDSLFDRMKKDGYEWDVSEKELNKIVFCNVPKCLNDLFSSTTFLIDKGIKQETGKLKCLD